MSLKSCMRLQREIQNREDAVKQIKEWLDQAQGQLQRTQEALCSSENECAVLKRKLAEVENKEASLTVRRPSA